MGRPRRKRVKKAAIESIAEQPSEDSTYNVISICFEHAKLKLDSLSRIATTSRKARTMVQLFLQQNASLLLPGICNKASELKRKAAEKPAEWSKLVQLVKWFCSMVGKQALQQEEVTSQVLMVRKTPPAIARMLLDAGMEVTHQQLVAAAYKRAEGLEVWVIQPFSNNLPVLTQALCGCNMIQLKKFLATNLTPADLPDMLVLAVDLLSSAAAETMLSYILIDQQQHLTAMHQQLSAIQHQQQRRETRRSVQKQLKQQDLAAEATQLQAQIVLTQQQLQSVQLVEQLLTLAVARRHHLVVQQLCQLDAAKDVPVADLLHRAIGHKGAQEEVLDNLMHLLAKANVPLPSDKLVAILRLAVQRRNHHAVSRLVLQQAAQDLDTPAVVALLTTSVQLKDCASAEHLCSLPAAQDTSSDIVRGLLATAVRLRCPGLARTLCALPATAQVSSAAYTNLMTAAVEQGATLVLFELARCRAGQLLTAACAAEILNVALGAGPLNDSILNALCDYLPAAAAIDRDSMSSLLLRAIREPHSVIVQRLCVLHPAVGQLTADDIIYLLRTALEQRVPSCVPHICQLPAAQFIPPSSLFSIMERGLQCNKAGGVLQIFNGLPMVVQQLNADQVAKLLNSSMQAGMPALHVVRSLTALPAAQQISSDALTALFGAVMRNQAGAEAALLLLQPAKDLEPDCIRQLIKEAFILDKATVAVQLMRLPMAQSLCSGAIAELLQILLEQTKTTSQLICNTRCHTCPETECIKKLCSLPAAENISPAALTTILHLIMRLPGRLSCGTFAPQVWLDRIGSLTKATGSLTAQVGSVVGPSGQPCAGTEAGSLGPAGAIHSAATSSATAVGSLALLPAATAAASPPVAGGSAGIVTLEETSSNSAGSATSNLLVAASLGPASSNNSSNATVAVHAGSYMGYLLGVAIVRQAWTLKTLCSWEAAQGLSSAEMENLLALAITPMLPTSTQHQGFTQMQWASRLGGCNKLRPEAVARLLQSAIRQGREEAVKYLSRIEPGAKQIDTPTVLALLHAAIQLPFGKAVHYICHLEGAKGMTTGDVADVLRMNEEMGFAFDVNTLRSCLYKAVQQPLCGAHTIA